MSTRNFDAVIFDTDQTLVNSKPVVEQAFGKVMNALYNKDLTFTDLPHEQYSGVSIYDIWRFMLAKIGCTPDDIEAEMPKAVHALHQELAGCIVNPDDYEQGRLACPGVPELLEVLLKQGIHRAVYTGATSPMNSILLTSAGIIGYFSTVRSCAGKDDSRITILKRAHNDLESLVAGAPIEPQRVLVVGDSLKDISTAHELEMKALGVATGGAPLETMKECADYALETLEDTEYICSHILGI